MQTSAYAQTQPEQFTQFAILTLKVKWRVTAYIQTGENALRNTRVSVILAKLS